MCLAFAHSYSHESSNNLNLLVYQCLASNSFLASIEGACGLLARICYMNVMLAMVWAAIVEVADVAHLSRREMLRSRCLRYAIERW